MIKACITREPGCCQCLEANELDVEECPGCILGDQVTNNLVTDQLVAESLGRAMLDENHKDKRRISGSCSLHEYMKPKSLVQMTDRVHGTYMAKLSKFAIAISIDTRGGFSAKSHIEVIKVHEE